MYTTEVDQARKMKTQGNMNRVLLYNIWSYVSTIKMLIIVSCYDSYISSYTCMYIHAHSNYNNLIFSIVQILYKSPTA